MRFLIVLEDAMWGNKTTHLAKIGNLGNVIKEVTKDLKLMEDFDYEKYNTKDPLETGTFGRGFYDLYFEDDSQDTYRIMIFVIPE